MYRNADDFALNALPPLALRSGPPERCGIWPWRDRWLAIIRKVTITGDHDIKDARIQRLVNGSGVRTLAFVNAHGLNLCVHDARFAANLLAADVLLRDGIGVKALFRLAGWTAGLNLNGTDLLPQIFPHFRGRRIALFGTRAETVEKVADYMERALGSNVVTADGFQPDHYYVDKARRERPSLIILGMGMPKQERVARLLKAQLQDEQDVLIVCGGAILDFLSGHVPRAPDWMRRAGLEWLYRFGREPTRLFYRYAIGNPVFVARSIALAHHRQPAGAILAATLGRREVSRI